MKTFEKMMIYPLAATIALLGACSKQAEPSGHAETDGHNHAKATVAATAESHANDHGAEGVGANDGSGGRMCPEHNVSVEECGICKPQLAATLKVGESAKVRLAAADSAAIAGVQIAAPTVGTIADGIEC